MARHSSWVTPGNSSPRSSKLPIADSRKGRRSRRGKGVRPYVKTLLPALGGTTRLRRAVDKASSEDGKIAEIWDTRNTLGILHQLNPDIAGHGHHH